jgi:threonine synthase
VFVGENIDETKRMEILRFAQDDKVQVKQVANPKQSAFQMAKTSGVINLRQSTDDSALVGYKELARELAEIKNLSAVFIPTSSGTTAQGLYLGFQKLGVNPQIHIVQTTACHPMINKSKIKDQNTGCEPAVAKIDADELDPTAYSWRNDNAEKSLASAIVDKVAHRKNKILEILKNSQGNGWVATNDDIQNAIALTKQNENIDISPNSALALVGLRQALAHGCKFNGPVVIIITGR